MKIKTEVLKKALETIKPGLASKEIIEQSTSFAFMNGNVVAYNDEISVRCPVPIDIEGAIPAGAVFAFVSRAPKSEISLKVTENEIKLKSGRARAGIRLEHEVNLPLDELGGVEGSTDWIDVPDNFLPAFQFCLPAASQDMTHPILTCVHVSGRIVQASDNYRISRFDMGKDAKKYFPDGVLIPASAGAELVKHRPSQYCLTEGWIHFKMEEGIIFSCRMYQEAFPDTSDFMKVTGERVTLPKLKDTLDRASVFAQEEFGADEKIIVQIHKNRIRIKASNEVGWFEEFNKLKEPVKNPIEFAIHPKYLKDILTKSPLCTIGERSVKFAGSDRERKTKWEHVVVIRVVNE